MNKVSVLTTTIIKYDSLINQPLARVKSIQVLLSIQESGKWTCGPLHEHHNGRYEVLTDIGRVHIKKLSIT